MGIFFDGKTGLHEKAEELIQSLQKQKSKKTGLLVFCLMAIILFGICYKSSGK